MPNWRDALKPLLPEDDILVSLYLDAGRKWVEENTSYRFQQGVEIPPGVQAFLVKYVETMEQGAGNVQSESIAGLSQSFRDVSLENLLIEWAAALMPEYFRSAGFVPAVKRWEE